MLYTKKGDNGTTKLFNCAQGQRVSKSELIFEALGTVDELNCALGYAKVLAQNAKNTLFFKTIRTPYEDIIEKIQQILFLVQAELGGSDIHTKDDHVTYIEDVVFEVETILPPINSFIIYGGGQTGAFLDLCRSIARRAERLVIAVSLKQQKEIHPNTIKFFNRLSSVLYALARYANYEEGFVERKPSYQ